MDKYQFKNEHELYKNYKNGFDYNTVKDLWTDYFDAYDYVVGDYSYGKIRLKGFYDKKSKKVKKCNNFEKIDDYIAHQCAYDCAYFILKKL